MLTLTCCQDHILTENIWFVWSETSYSGDERRCYRCGTNEQTVKIELLSQWKLEAEFRKKMALNWHNDHLFERCQKMPKVVKRCQNLQNLHSQTLWVFFIKLVKFNHIFSQFLCACYMPASSNLFLRSEQISFGVGFPVEREFFWNLWEKGKVYNWLESS